jgi:D-ornithine---citrate ligase
VNFSGSTIPACIAEQWQIAIKTAPFTRYVLAQTALEPALRKASQRAFQRLIQALFREGIIDPTQLHLLPDGHQVLSLSNHACLLFSGLRSGRMNSWSLEGGVVYLQNNQMPRSIVLPSELLALLAPLFAEAVTAEVLTRLSQELDNSLTNDTLSLAFHEAWSRHLSPGDGLSGPDFLAGLKAAAADDATLLLEQWGTTGHPWHPNYKTKLGLSTEQVIAFSPEFAARFEITLCALHRDFAHVEQLPGSVAYREGLGKWLPQALQRFDETLQRLGLDPADYLPIPVHPWQAAHTLPDLFAQEIGDRLLVLTNTEAFAARPTMSFRTVLPDTRHPAPMVKLPVGLRLTSVQRTVSPRSACMGPRVSALLASILQKEAEIRRVLSIVPEQTGIHYKSPYPQDDRARHLSVLFRANPRLQLRDGELAIPVGSLFTLDHSGQPLLAQWVALAEGSCSGNAACAFLDRYLNASLPGLLCLYLVHGIAFEAHQQNSFMVMGEDMKPSRILIRDFGDIRIHRQTLNRHGMTLELQDPAMTLFDDAGFVRDKLLHTVFMCHLGELILLLSRRWNIPEAGLWETLRGHVSQCFDALRERTEPDRWEEERRALLEEDWPAKSFLRMRLLDCPTDIVGRLKNPLTMAAHAE